MDRFRKADKEHKAKQKSQFDHRHGVRLLSALPTGTKVWVKSGKHQIAGRIVSPAGTPRSYIVSTPSGQIRRNRHHLNIRKENLDSDISLELETSTPVAEGPATTPRSVPPIVTRSPVRTRSQTGTVIRPPERYTE